MRAAISINLISSVQLTGDLQGGGFPHRGRLEAGISFFNKKKSELKTKEWYSQMGISSEFLRRRVLSAITALAQGEDSARTNLEGAGGSLLHQFWLVFYCSTHTGLCPIMSMSSWVFWKPSWYASWNEWLQVQWKEQQVHLQRMTKAGIQHHRHQRTPIPPLLSRLSSPLSALSAWSERSFFKKKLIW